MARQWDKLKRKLIRTTLPLLVLIIYGLLSRLPDLRLAVPEWIAGCALIVILIVLGVYRGQTGSAAWSSSCIIMVGAVSRLLFLMRPSELSDDIYRYVFDGQVLLSGNNPYQASPQEMVFTHPSLAGLAELINHADLPTIYPPAAQFVFAAGAFFGGVFGMKLFLVILDLLSCILMARIISMLCLQRSYLILYAWHPLPILEIAGSGHIDGAAIFFILLGLFLLLRTKHTAHECKFVPFARSGWMAGFALAAAVLTKWLPLVFLPGAFRLCSAGNRRKAVYGFLLGGFILISFFWPDVQNGFHTLWIYAANWEFSGLLFRKLRAVLDSGGTARLILAAVFGIITVILYLRCVQTIAKRRHEKAVHSGLPVFQAMYGVIFTFLVLTPTLHPWYALYLAALLPFAGGPAGMVFSWSILLSYRVLILYAMTGQWVESDAIPLLVMAGPAAAGAASLLFTSRRTG